jgi:hypothetical protein
VERYRITITGPEQPEQTWVLLPDLESASMQAEELARREKQLHVRVYREPFGERPELAAEFGARPA